VSDDNLNPQPDPTTIRAHLERLFRRARTEYPEGRCEIAWADARGAVNSAETFGLDPDSLDAATATAARYNAAGRNTYVGVNPRKPFGRASAADVEIAFVQFIDGDSPQTANKLRQAPIPYSWAVTTGRIPNPRPQAYWDLEEPTRNLKAWSDRQLALAEFFGADHVIDPPRIMRLAGTTNYPAPKKAARGYIVESVTLRTLYDGTEREPLSWEILDRAYPNVKPNGYANGHASNGYDPDTGEVFEERPRPNFQTDRVDPQTYVDAIKAGHNLHNNARQLIDHLVSTGRPNWLIREFLLALLKPVSDGGTISQISDMIRTWRDRTGIPDSEDEDFDAPQAQSPLILVPVGILDPRKRAPRDWLVPNRMMRRHITMTTAAPGVGKSTLAIEEAVSLGSGVDFLSLGITKSHRVAIINNEETKDELERRIEATCQHFEIDPHAIAETIFLYSGVDADKLILSKTDRQGNVIATPRTAELRTLIDTLKIDVVILDPFVQLNHIEESSNEQISRAMQEIRSLGATGYSAAIHLIHHNRKPPAGNAHQAGDINAARGASSMGGEAHFFFTLADMSNEDAEHMNVAESDKINFIRLDDAKRKMSAAQGARWFERYGVHMPYGLMGEEVGVLIPRDMDEVENKVSIVTATEILQRIDEAWIQGTPLSESPQTKSRYVIHYMMREFQVTRNTAKSFLRDWLRNAVVATAIRDPRVKLRGLQVLKWPG
jgi:hypothetical protein